MKNIIPKGTETNKGSIIFDLDDLISGTNPKTRIKKSVSEITGDFSGLYPKITEEHYGDSEDIIIN